MKIEICNGSSSGCKPKENGCPAQHETSHVHSIGYGVVGMTAEELGERVFCGKAGCVGWWKNFPPVGGIGGGGAGSNKKTTSFIVGGYSPSYPHNCNWQYVSPKDYPDCMYVNNAGDIINKFICHCGASKLVPEK